MNIIQTWKDIRVPYTCFNFIEKLKSLNANYKYFFFTDSDIVNFVKSFYPEYFDVFKRFKYKIQQIDFFRYLAIYHYGGIYLDIDMEINQSFDDMDFTVCNFPIEYKTDTEFTIGNYAFYAPEKHPFLKHIIDNIIINADADLSIIEKDQDNSVDNRECVYIYSTTGPIFIKNCYLKYENKNDVLLLEPEIFEAGRFGKYGKHNEFGYWKHNNNVYIPLTDS